jgi:cobalt transporter subunit CbtA
VVAVFRGIVFSAVGAGLAVCLAVTVLQAFTTEPLILDAERFEEAGRAAHDDIAAAGEPAPVGHDHDAGPWQPANGFERTAFTALANLLMGIAVSAILLSLMLIKGKPIDGRRGLLWGAAGFTAASLLPALGLPPELPGTPAADLLDRQLWWLATVGASAGGIALIVLGRHWTLRAAGAAILVLPHAVGAPPPASHDVAYPEALAGQFVIASLVVSAVLWSVAGVTAGWLHQRLARTA